MSSNNENQDNLDTYRDMYYNEDIYVNEPVFDEEAWIRKENEKDEAEFRNEDQTDLWHENE